MAQILPSSTCKASVGDRERERQIRGSGLQEGTSRRMKRAELGLLEVLGLLVRMPGEGDVTALPCFVGS
jgi:hypothetical protein